MAELLSGEMNVNDLEILTSDGLFLNAFDFGKCRIDDDNETESVTGTYVALNMGSVNFCDLTSTMKAIHPYVKKRTIDEGVFGTLSVNSTVLVDMELYVKGETKPFDSTILRKKPSRLKLDDGNLLEGIQVALLSMRLKETAHFLIGWQVLYGAQGCPPRCPPKAEVFATIHVSAIRNTCAKPEGFEATMAECEAFLQQAKKHYVENNNGHRSIHIMKRAITLLNQCPANEDQVARIDKLTIRMHAYLSGLYNSVNNPEKAIIHAREALRIDDTCQKALYAIGRAHMYLCNFRQADMFLRKGLHLYPNDEYFKKESTKLTKKMKEYSFEN